MIPDKANMKYASTMQTAMTYIHARERVEDSSSVAVLDLHLNTECNTLSSTEVDDTVISGIGKSIADLFQ